MLQLPIAFTLLITTAPASSPIESGEADESLPFDRLELEDLDELEAAAHAHREDRVTAEAEPSMRPAGVDDPFPDRIDRTRARDVWVPAALGLGLAGAGAIMGRLALLPDCGAHDDITTCSVPTEGDIGVRGGRVIGAVGFGVGGAVFGALAGRAFARRIGQDTSLSLLQKRRIVIGAGTTAVVLGTAGMLAGAAVLGVSTRRAIDVGRDLEGVDTNALSDEEYAQVDSALGEIRRARAGLMVLVATPTLFATGVSLLVHRARPSRVSVSPQVSPSYAGISVRLRF